MRVFMILLICITSFSVTGQPDLLDKNGSKYFYKGKSYDCKDLGSVYELHQPSMDLYLEELEKKQKAKSIGTMGFIVFFGGLTATTITIGQSNDNVDIISTIGLLAIASSAIIQIVAMSLSGEGSQRFKKARNIFNNEMRKLHRQNSEVKLIIGGTGNGIGLVVQF